MSITPYDRDAVDLDAPWFGRLHWRGIVGGTVASLAIAWMLNALGVAIGLSLIEPRLGEFGTQGGAIGAVVWAIVSVAIGSFVGGYVSVRATRIRHQPIATMQGLVSWALGFLATTFFLAFIGTGLANGAAFGTAANPNTNPTRTAQTADNTTTAERVNADRAADTGSALGWMTFLSGICGLAASVGGASAAVRARHPEEPIDVRKRSNVHVPVDLTP